MATPNYSFEKRKRELAKKAAKEAKRLRKEEKPATSEGGAIIENTDAPPESDDSTSPATDC
jgi:hypothetical protein